MNKNETNKKKLNIFALVRMVLYLILIITFILIDPDKLESRGSFCGSFLIFGIKCPTCGVTRGFCNFLHLNFVKAYSYNKLFTICIFPLAIFIMIDDVVNTIYRSITKKERYSLFEYFVIKVFLWK